MHTDTAPTACLPPAGIIDIGAGYGPTLVEGPLEVDLNPWIEGSASVYGLVDGLSTCLFDGPLEDCKQWVAAHPLTPEHPTLF